MSPELPELPRNCCGTAGTACVPGTALLLENGRARAAGTPAEVLTEEMIASVYRARVLIQPNPVSGRPHMVLAAKLAEERGA